jgi:hypothetical protein
MTTGQPTAKDVDDALSKYDSAARKLFAEASTSLAAEFAAIDPRDPSALRAIAAALVILAGKLAELADLVEPTEAKAVALRAVLDMRSVLANGIRNGLKGRPDA